MLLNNASLCKIHDWKEEISLLPKTYRDFALGLSPLCSNVHLLSLLLLNFNLLLSKSKQQYALMHKHNIKCIKILPWTIHVPFCHVFCVKHKPSWKEIAASVCSEGIITVFAAEKFVLRFLPFLNSYIIIHSFFC